eukprot:TRINITY_DN7497_c0_g1_i1.p2 TRINITY_DN7497_c0_g1~~TRINITY_DN7497_c0_g1_i1.p2  ORF type:complete len:50 (-),score=2.97 TRINITY_DN7497_c0_g1_i1:13-162(-)
MAVGRVRPCTCVVCCAEGFTEVDFSTFVNKRDTDRNRKRPYDNVLQPNG